MHVSLKSKTSNLDYYDVISFCWCREGAQVLVIVAMISSSSSSPPPSSSRPRDGPATLFEVDPVMAEILRSEESSMDDFGLVLVVGWPPNQDEMEAPYAAFVKSMRSCFDHDDEENAYIYPLDSLHITVATFHHFSLETRDPEQRSILEREWRQVALAASKRPEWPKYPLKLEIDSCQIGTHAGILLWRETTGGLDSMRFCLARETSDRQSLFLKAGLNVDTLKIPDIVHSSILRYPSPIKTNGELVQERLRKNVLPRLKEIFPKPMTASTAVLVYERTPYLHLPYDDSHALETFELTET